MTTGMHSLKAPPLLNPPDKTDTLDECPVECVNRLVEKLGFDRKSGLRYKGLYNARRIWHLRSVGVPVEVTKDDEYAMRRELAEWRNKRDGDAIAEQLFLMKQLRVDVEVTEEDKERIRGKLEEER